MPEARSLPRVLAQIHRCILVTSRLCQIQVSFHQLDIAKSSFKLQRQQQIFPCLCPHRVHAISTHAFEFEILSFSRPVKQFSLLEVCCPTKIQQIILQRLHLMHLVPIEIATETIPSKLELNAGNLVATKQICNTSPAVISIANLTWIQHSIFDVKLATNNLSHGLSAPTRRALCNAKLDCGASRK